jgi:hypothetical protein
MYSTMVRPMSRAFPDGALIVMLKTGVPPPPGVTVSRPRSPNEYRCPDRAPQPKTGSLMTPPRSNFLTLPPLLYQWAASSRAGRGACASAAIADLPAGARWLRRPAGGYRYTVVDGTVVRADGELTSARPGSLLRPGR